MPTARRSKDPILHLSQLFISTINFLGYLKRNNVVYLEWRIKRDDMNTN